MHFWRLLHRPTFHAHRLLTATQPRDPVNIDALPFVSRFGIQNIVVATASPHSDVTLHVSTTHLHHTTTTIITRAGLLLHMVTPLCVTSPRWGVRPHRAFLSFQSTISQPLDLPLLRSVVHQGRKTLKAATISTRHFQTRDLNSDQIFILVFPSTSYRHTRL